jgi:hypothetical protein
MCIYSRVDLGSHFRRKRESRDWFSYMSNVVRWTCIRFHVVGKGSGDKTGAELDGLVGGQTESAKPRTY